MNFSHSMTLIGKTQSFKNKGYIYKILFKREVVWFHYVNENKSMKHVDKCMKNSNFLKISL